MTENNKSRPIVLIDLDNTILNFDIAERSALTTAFREYGIEPTEELLRRYSVINKRYWEMLERGEMSREKLRVGRFQELFDEIGCEVPAAEVQDRYEEVLSSGHWFMPGQRRFSKRFTESAACSSAQTATRRCRTGGSQAPG